MGTQTKDGRAVQGGPAAPVYITNGAADPVQGNGPITGPLGATGLAQSVATNDTSDTLYDGTKALTTVAAAIAASQAIREAWVQADPANTVDILVGSSTSQSTRLRPGQPVVIPINDLAKIFAKAVTGTASLNYLGRS
jgi:hypothetical protein